MQANTHEPLVARAVVLMLCSAYCVACGGANADFWSPSAGAPIAGAPSAEAGSSAGGAPNVAGAPASNAGAPASSAGAPASSAGAPDSAGGAAGSLMAVAGSAGSLPDNLGPRAMKSLVDDMEMNVSTILATEGRAGSWYAFNDGQGGSQLPAPNGPFLPEQASDGFPGSMRARHTHGSGFQQYAGFGFDLNNPSGKRQVYDASAYEGVVLWVRGNVNVRVLFATRATAPIDQGGDCAASCNDSFGFELQASPQWEQRTVPFNTLTQLSPVIGGTFDAKQVLGIAFAVPKGSEFDVWVDEIGFY